MHGIGTDIVTISRVAHWADDNDALDFIYTVNERALALKGRHPSRHLAAAFAVKEAFMKAVGTGWGGGVQWKDIEMRVENGRVSVRLYNRAKELCCERTVLADANCAGDLAVAFVVID